MTDTVVPAAPVKRRRWPWVLMFVSLALNALLVGVIIRGLWTVRASMAMTGAGIETSLPAFVNTLPAQRRDELRQSSLSNRPGPVLRPLRVEMRRARQEAHRAFVADPFDKQAFIAAQARLLEAETKLRQAVHNMLPEIGERLTAAERRDYLGWRGHGWGQASRWRGRGRGQATEPDDQIPGGSPRRP